MSLNYCPDVWKNLYVNKIDHQRVSLGFCCQNTTEPANLHDWQEVVRKKREDFVAHEWPSQCNGCWNVEKLGSASKRHGEINWYAQQGLAQDRNVDLISLEWNSENLCNLACVTCGPIYSSRWSSEIKRYPWQDVKTFQPSDQNKFYSNLDLSGVRRLYFNGGEPLLCHDHVQIMQMLQSIGTLDKCEIGYNTNGTVIPDQNVLDLWQDAALIRIFVSIDAIEDSFEFIRWPAKWKQIVNFLSFLRSQPFNIIIDITCTLGIHNIFSLHKLHAWHAAHCDKNHQGDPVTLNLQLCSPISHGGKVLSLSHIGAKLSDLAAAYLSDLDIGINLSTFISICTQANGNDREWVSYLDLISAARKMNWRGALPELAMQYRKIA